jgi:hypothetical protein
MKNWLLLAMICLVLGACSSRRALPQTGTEKPPETPLQETFSATRKVAPPGGPGAGASPSPAAPSDWTQPTLQPGQTEPTPEGDLFFETPTPAAPALPEDDEFLRRMKTEGYTLFQSGSLAGERGSIYSAHIFTRFVFGEPVGADTFVVAFYRRVAGVNRFLNSLTPAAYTRSIPVYPSYYRLVNWDDLPGSTLGLSAAPDWDAEARRSLQVGGFAADINANGRPEFILAGEYCPIACSYTALGFDVFEVQSDRVVDLSAGLPGRIRLPAASLDPAVFDAGDAYWFGAASQIYLPMLVTWDGSRFVEAEPRLAEAGLAPRLQAYEQRLQSAYGGRFTGEQYQADALNILFGYERLGKPREGLEAFLEVTDPGNWDIPNQRALCWLQTARAHAQNEYDRGAPFSLPPPQNASQGLYPGPPLDELAASLRTAGYDVSACR